MSAMHRLTGRATCSQHQVCLTNSRHTSAISTARISDSRHRTAQHQQHALGQDTLDFSKKIRTAQPGSQLAVKRRDVLGLGALAAVTLLVAEVPSLTLPSATHAAPSTQLRSLSSEEQAAVDKALKAISKTKAPVALRLVFHDAGTYRVSTRDGGANASIRLELDRPENFGLKRGWSIIKQLSDSLKGTPAAGLSYADLIALAGAQAVAVCAGPRIPVRVGRQDAVVADPIGRLPAETLSAQQQKEMFAAMGISTREFMALMGSHTIGNKGFGAPDKFDNVYYDSLLKRPWTNTKDEMASMIGLPSDHVLPDDPELAPIIEEYARDEAAFLKDFTAAYIKLTELGA